MLSYYKAFIIDLDGCIYRGDAPIPGAVDVVGRLKKLGKKVLFLTNNATRRPEEYFKKLKGMGFEVSVEEVLTSATVTALYIAKSFGKARIFPVGGEGLVGELRKAGHEVIEDLGLGKVDFVIACLDLNFTYEKLKDACQAIFSGAKFIATNMDPTVPVEGGFIPGAGAIVASISTATSIKPLVIGKPSHHMIECALEKLGVKASQAVIIGDRLDTDIQVGKEAGLFTILVLTGATKIEDVEKTDNLNQKPDLILSSISELSMYL